MTDNVQTASVGASAPPDDDLALHRRRVTFVAPTSIPTTATLPASDHQEHHPVNQTLDLDLPTPVAEVSPITPRPVSVPSHRADVVLDDVPPTDSWEARPASVARHSVDTSVITLPVLAVAVPDDLPQPPERLTLDDDVLARLVEKRLDDTATVDLMAVVQAQLALRRVEAARFASWEDEISRVGTDEAAQALEHTRLRFTGVLRVIPAAEAEAARLARPVIEAGHAPVAPDATAVVAAPADQPADGPVAVPATAEASAAEAPDGAERVSAVASESPAEEALLEGTPVEEAPVASSSPVAEAATPVPVAPSPLPTAVSRRTILVAGTVAILVVVAAIVLAFVPGVAIASAIVATVALPVAAGLAGLAALLSVSTRPDDAARVARRGPVGVVAGVVVGTVVGLGLLSSDLASFAWQGFIARLVGLTGLVTSVSVLVALLACALAAFIVAVMITGFRSTARD